MSGLDRISQINAVIIENQQKLSTAEAQTDTSSITISFASERLTSEKLREQLCLNQIQYSVLTNKIPGFDINNNNHVEQLRQLSVDLTSGSSDEALAYQNECYDAETQAAVEDFMNGVAGNIEAKFKTWLEGNRTEQTREQARAQFLETYVQSPEFDELRPEEDKQLVKAMYTGAKAAAAMSKTEAPEGSLRWGFEQAEKDRVEIFGK
jgi:hypothetical protein